MGGRSASSTYLIQFLYGTLCVGLSEQFFRSVLQHGDSDGAMAPRTRAEEAMRKTAHAWIACIVHQRAVFISRRIERAEDLSANGTSQRGMALSRRFWPCVEDDALAAPEQHERSDVLTRPR